MDLVDELVHVLRALGEAHVETAVCGAFAVAIHGAPRFTKDIDVLIQETDIDRALAAVRDVGFDMAAMPMTFDAGTDRERRIQRVSKVDGSDLLTLDFVLATPVLADVWRDRAVAVWRDREVHVVSLGGLVRMKRLASRPQDLLDLVALGVDAED